MKAVAITADGGNDVLVVVVMGPAGVNICWHAVMQVFPNVIVGESLVQSNIVADR